MAMKIDTEWSAVFIITRSIIISDLHAVAFTDEPIGLMSREGVFLAAKY